MAKLNKIIAGLGVVAGLGVALAPVATYAGTTAGSDTVNIQVNSDCAIKASTTPFGGTFSGSATPSNTATATGGSSTVVFDCSTNSKVSVSASTSGLSSTNGDTIAADHLKVSLSGTNGLSAASAFDDQYGTLAASETVVATGTDNGTADMTLTVNGYQAVLKDNQKPGAYTGTVAYTYALVNE